jgi:rare lipoprotein A
LTLGACTPGFGGGGFLARLFGRRPPPPAPSLHYVVGDPYQRGGIWHYPRADFTLEQTGLAAIAPGRAGLTADGEAFDATALAAGHATLQLPAIARVTDLENGRSVLVRVNDRGPAAAGRMLELTPRAAELLGARDGTQLRLVVQEAESRQLAAALQGDGPHLDLAVAPTAEIRTENLAAPSGAASGRVRAAPSGPAPIASAAPATAPPVPARLPEQVMQFAAQPGRLFIDAGAFSQAQYARLLAGRLGGLGAEVVTDYAAPRDRAYQVRLGPFASVAEADAALDRARRAGVTDGRIIVQP